MTPTSVTSGKSRPLATICVPTMTSTSPPPHRLEQRAWAPLRAGGVQVDPLHPCLGKHLLDQRSPPAGCPCRRAADTGPVHWGTGPGRPEVRCSSGNAGAARAPRGTCSATAHCVAAHHVAALAAQQKWAKPRRLKNSSACCPGRAFAPAPPARPGAEHGPVARRASPRRMSTTSMVAAAGRPPAGPAAASADSPSLRPDVAFHRRRRAARRRARRPPAGPAPRPRRARGSGRFVLLVGRLVLLVHDDRAPAPAPGRTPPSGRRPRCPPARWRLCRHWSKRSPSPGRCAAPPPGRRSARQKRPTSAASARSPAPARWPRLPWPQRLRDGAQVNFRLAAAGDAVQQHRAGPRASPSAAMTSNACRCSTVSGGGGRGLQPSGAGRPLDGARWRPR